MAKVTRIRYNKRFSETVLIENGSVGTSGSHTMENGAFSEFGIKVRHAWDNDTVSDTMSTSYHFALSREEAQSIVAHLSDMLSRGGDRTA